MLLHYWNYFVLCSFHSHNHAFFRLVLPCHNSRIIKCDFIMQKTVCVTYPISHGVTWWIGWIGWIFFVFIFMACSTGFLLLFLIVFKIAFLILPTINHYRFLQLLQSIRIHQVSPKIIFWNQRVQSNDWVPLPWSFGMAFWFFCLFCRGIRRVQWWCRLMIDGCRMAWIRFLVNLARRVS